MNGALAELSGKGHKLREIEMRDEHTKECGGFPFDDKKYKKPFFNDIEMNAILRILAPKRGEIIADLGCGSGRFTFEIVKKGGGSVPMDFSFESLLKLRGEMRNMSPIQAEICSIPIKSEQVKKIISIQVIQHLPTKDDMIKAFSEMKRILKGKGNIVVSVLQKRGNIRGKLLLSSDLNLYCTLYARKDLSELAKRAGLRNIRIYSSNINHRISDKISRMCQNRKKLSKIWVNLSFYLSNLPLLSRYCEFLILVCNK